MTGDVLNFGACAVCGAGAGVASSARVRGAGIGDEDKPPIGDPEDDEGYVEDEDDDEAEEDDDEETLWTLGGSPGIAGWRLGTASHNIVL